jgi:hypothetical protein
MSHAQREAQVSGGKPDSPRWNAIIGSRLSDSPVCKPANPAFTMSRKHRTTSSAPGAFIGLNSALSISVVRTSRDGGADRDRTDDLKLAKLALSQLSYGPSVVRCLQWRRQVVGPGRVERPTSRLSGVRSNHLSYEPPARMARRSRGQIPSQIRRERAGLLRHRIAIIRARSRGHRRKGRETKTAETYQGRPADRMISVASQCLKPGNRIRFVQARRNSESRSLERR